MKRLYFKYPLTMIACALLSLLSYSCSDELEYNSPNARVEEGLPATIKVAVKVNDMSTKSRTIADEASANYCNNLWIGLYSKDSGKRIDYFYTKDVAAEAEVIDTKYVLTFNTVSANDVYIVAVANCDVNSGVENVEKYGTSTSTLRDMLDEANTWTKFKNLCVLRPDAKDVNVYASTLTMSGYYSMSADDDIQTVTIAEGDNNDFSTDDSGSIYLKRILSYNKFIISPGPNVNLTLNTWRVGNIPAGCSVLEQDGNIADGYKGNASFYNTSTPSHIFRLYNETVATNDGSKYFEFYQLENKHTALDYAADGTDHVGISPNVDNMYTEREREFKNADGTNSGVYRSLVNSSKSNMYNNNASYVVINATVDYYIDASLVPDRADEAEPVDPATFNGQTIHRTATVEYTIHLGYCEGKNDDGSVSLNTAKDFNCRRNTKYTYKATINGVKNIVVEATKNPENQPGAEGWVSDEIGSYERLDSHYCEFNICLTDDERNSMSYRITAPYDNKYYYCIREKDQLTATISDGMNEELYSWIKFAPTTDKNTLAKYNGGKDLWTIDDMCAPTARPNDAKADADGGKWYTVFIDEYVYHFDDKSGAETSWPCYVNQDDRIVEFIMNDKKSTDNESSYSYCKYAFAQKSIQSFYKGTEGDKAVGIEHYEETYCLNMDWDALKSKNASERSSGLYNLTDGRYNLYHYLQAKNKQNWTDVIQETVPGHVPADENTEYGCSHPEADYPVYMPKAYNGKPSNRPCPSYDNYYIANSICMNRNRDLNGNGVIDTDEIRWYLPTSSMYIQTAIAQSELPDPIIHYTDYPIDYFCELYKSGERFGVFNFHYITSDYQYFWAEQYVATGDNPWGGWNSTASAAYTARCARNLGTDLSKAPELNKSEVDNAFTYNAGNRTFTQTNFSDNMLRGYSNGGIMPHDVASPFARPSKKFEYAKHTVVGLSDKYLSFGADGKLSVGGNNYTKTVAWSNSLKDNGICGQYSQEADKSDLGTWRVPTAGELSLMWIENIPQNTAQMELGYLTINKNESYYFSATHDYFVSYKTWDVNKNGDYANGDYGDDYGLYMGYNDKDDRKVIANDCIDNTGLIRLRCVRDVR
jgi:hypothetical protein